MKDISNIVETHNQLISKVARVYSDNNADFDDLYQEIIIQIWRSIEKFKSKSKLTTYIYRIALNTAINYKKKSDRNPVTLDLSDLEIADQSGQTTEVDPKVQILHKAINKLEKSERAIILLFLDQLSYKEISEVIGISVSNVGVKISRIKTKLFKMLN